MKFIGAYQSLNELSEKVAILEEEQGKAADHLLVVTLEEHKEDIEKMVDIRVKTVDVKTVKENDPLEEYGLDHESAELYEETIRLGGYVLLEDVEEKDAHHSTGTRDAKEDKGKNGELGDIPAPGFGVSQDDPSRKE